MWLKIILIATGIVLLLAGIASTLLWFIYTTTQNSRLSYLFVVCVGAIIIGL